MKHWILAACAAAALVACGGSGDDAGSQTPAPPVDVAPTERGVPTGPAVAATIGPAGGSLSSAGGELTVVVPAGAFASAQQVTIQPITSFAPGARGKAWRIGPEGLRTTVPMTLRWHYDDDSVSGTHPSLLSVATQDTQQRWRRHRDPVLDSAAGTVTVGTRHFSDWSMVAGAQLLPQQASVRVGQSLALAVNECVDYGQTPDPDDDMLPGYVCSTAPTAAGQTSGWAVNGAPGGGAPMGTVVQASGAGEALATYTAPAARPEPDTVAVSARYRKRGGEQLLVANVKILPDTADPADCQGWRNVRNLKADVSFDSFSHTMLATDRIQSGTHAGRLIGELIQLTSTDAEGVWMGHVHGPAAGAVSISDTYSYTPAGGGGYSGSLEGSGPPEDTLVAPSMITLTLTYASCRFDLLGSFSTNVITTRDGEATSQVVRIGALYLYRETAPASQREGGTLQGTRTVQAQSENDLTGYVPVMETLSDWTHQGQTTARWSILPR